MTVWHRPLDADIVPLARFQLKQKQLKDEATNGEKPANGVSSAGQSMSSREDLLEEQLDQSATMSPGQGHRYGQNVTRFGSIQPNRSGLHQYSKSCVTQSSTNLQQKKVTPT